eukprot:gene45958-57296_t
MAFAATSGPVFFRLDSKQNNFIASVFEQIIQEQDTSYMFSHELFCNYMNLILHEVLKKTTANIPALAVAGLITSEFLPVSILTPIARDLHVTEGMAGQAISIISNMSVSPRLTLSARSTAHDDGWIPGA